MENNVSTAKINKLGIAPRKVRLIINLIRGKNVNDAIAILKNCEKLGSEDILKLLNSAIANAINTKGLKANLLFVKEIMASDGPTLKRMHTRARGRSTRIFKRSSNVRILLSERKDK